MRIDLNADVGEGFPDEPLLPWLSSVNIACGGHAGNEAIMVRTLELAARHGLQLGAHPGYPDPEHFGRIALALPPADVTHFVADQVRTLAGLARDRGLRLVHVKPHGALYNQAARDRELASAIARAVLEVDPGLKLVGLAGSMLLEAGREAGLAVWGEGFVERRYLADGSLAPRSRPDAVIDDPAEAAVQAVTIARGQPISSVDGLPVRIDAQTLCLHGDSPHAAKTAETVRKALEAAGFDFGAG